MLWRQSIDASDRAINLRSEEMGREGGKSEKTLNRKGRKRERERKIKRKRGEAVVLKPIFIYFILIRLGDAKRIKRGRRKEKGARDRERKWVRQ